MGSGKTELLDKYLKQYKPTSCLWLSSRKTYSYSVQNRLAEHGFAMADDQEHVGQMFEPCDGYLICQIDSIPRCGRDTPFGILVLDEFMSLIQQIEDRYRLFSHL